MYYNLSGEKKKGKKEHHGSNQIGTCQVIFSPVPDCKRVNDLVILETFGIFRVWASHCPSTGVPHAPFLVQISARQFHVQADCRERKLTWANSRRMFHSVQQGLKCCLSRDNRGWSYPKPKRNLAVSEPSWTKKSPKLSARSWWALSPLTTSSSTRLIAGPSLKMSGCTFCVLLP
jgi:hypothetical protein